MYMTPTSTTALSPAKPGSIPQRRGMASNASIDETQRVVNGAALPVESIVVMDNLERIANNGVWK